MKMLLRKNLACILSLIIALSVILPVANIADSISVQSQEGQTANSAVEALKNAWSAMEITDKTELLPYRFYNNTTAIADTSLEAAPTVEGIDVGSKIFNWGINNTGSYTSSSYTLIYEKVKGNAEGAQIDFDNITEAYFTYKVNFVEREGNIYPRVFSSKGTVFNPNSSKFPTVTAEDVSRGWQKVSYTDLFGENWQTSFKNACSTPMKQLGRIFLMPGNLKADITFGAVIVETSKKAVLPDNIDSLSISALIEAAEAVDISEYTNTEEFVKALENLKKMNAEDAAINDLASAWGKLTYSDVKLNPYRYFNNSSIVADTTLIPTQIPDEKFADNTVAWSIDNEGTYNSNLNALIYEKVKNDSAGASVPFEEIEEVYFWYKVNSVEREGNLYTRAFSSAGTVFNPEASKYPTVTLADIDKGWQKVTYTDIFGEDWQTLFADRCGASQKTLGRLFIMPGNLKAEIVFSSLVIERRLDTPANTENWNLADWLYAANKLDVSGFGNTEQFVDAISKATEVKEELGVARSGKTESFADAAELDFTAFNNILTDFDVAVYNFDGTEKKEVKETYLLAATDKKVDYNAEIVGLNYNSDRVFTDIIYTSKGKAKIDKIMVSNALEQSLRNYKYSIYISDTPEALFDSDSLIANFTNENSDQLQVFDFTENSTVEGTYLALRVYAPQKDMSGFDGVIRFTELCVTGSVEIYEVEKGTFDNAKLDYFGANLLNSKTPYFKFAVGTKWSFKELFRSGGYKTTDFADNSMDTRIGCYNANCMVYSADDEITFFIYYDLGATYSIKTIAFNSVPNLYLQTGKYDIYTSTDINTLFLERSKIISYNNMADSENGSSVSQAFHMLGEGHVARYVAFCIKYPVCNYAGAADKYGIDQGVRIADLGVYGEEYEKPLKEVNLLSHVPTSVYRGDNNEPVPESEYNGTNHKLLYDGYYDDEACVDTKGEKVSFLFNLCGDMKLNSIKLSTLTENIKHMKIYASDSEETIWNENTLVYAYKSGSELSNRVTKSFDDEPLATRYLRIEILEADGDIFKPTEIEALGWNTQEFNYMNLIEEKYESYTIYLQDKETSDVKISFSDANRYIPYEQTDSKCYSINKALDNDYATVGDLFGGKDNEESLNIMFDLGTLNSVDSFTFRAGSSADYWPEKLNFYFGTDDIELFSKDAKPAKAWVSKTDDENGLYTYDFVPQVAQYVRIEILECSHEYYQRFGGGKMLIVISELAVNGLELIGTSDVGVAARLIDDTTGVRVDILGLRDNDVFTAVSDILVTKRPANQEETEGIAQQNINMLSDVYDIYLLDAEGNIVSNLGGRELRIYIPKNLIAKQDEVFVLAEEFGMLGLVEFTTQDDYYTYLSDGASGLTFALGGFAEFVEADAEIGDDTPTDTDNTVTDEDETETEDEEPEEEDEETSKKKRKVKVVRKGNGTDIFDYLWIIIVVVAVVIVAAGITLFLILAKKKKQQQEEDN
ncbi:MAG: hypothetical protein IJZ75_05410 [Clostridia bacterium]|nr:hypothetical protein [Clostridia bacterium]